MTIHKQQGIVHLTPGLSGIMCAKNEGWCIETCIDTVIDALDELVVVYNDCSDDTEDILRRKVEQYGSKIKVYSYNHGVFPFNLTPEEFEYVMSLPEDDPRLFCNQRNFALSHVSYQYVVKIDPDQIYFADEVRKWRDACCGKDVSINIMQKVIAQSFRIWFALYRRISLKSGVVCTLLMPDWLVKACRGSYLAYARYLLYKGKVSIAWSGINVFVENNRIFVPYDYRNVHPPYNGEGDHVLFKIRPEIKFYKYPLRGKRMKVLEYMYNPYPMWFCGPMWFHLHANREYCIRKVSEMKRENPDLFVEADEWLKFSYRDSLRRMRNGIPTLFQRTLFLLVHKIGMQVVRENLAKIRAQILRIFEN